jgi:hypothetical protein
MNRSIFVSPVKNDILSVLLLCMWQSSLCLQVEGCIVCPSMYQKKLENERMQHLQEDKHRWNKKTPLASTIATRTQARNTKW